MAMAAPKMGRPKKQVDDGNPPPEKRSIGMRVSVDYADWLEKLAKHYRTNVAGIIDRALAEWSQSEGYEHLPPERNP